MQTDQTVSRLEAFLALLLLAGSGIAEAQPSDDFPSFALAFQVADFEGRPVVDQAWIDEQVRWANQLFAPHGVTFRTHSVASMGTEHARLDTRSDRHQLGARVRPQVINCFVVESLKDVDVPDRFIRGVHWRSPLRPGKHYVILSRIAGPRVLAHELGHFFGNHQHSETPGNIMSYLSGNDPPFFDDGQIAIIRRHARHFLRSGELRPAD